MMAGFLAEAMRSGHKCTCVVDAETVGPVFAAIDEAIGSGGDPGRDGLEVISSKDAYLRGDGFCPDDMIAFWEEFAVSQLESGDFVAARATGEMSLALSRMVDLDDFLEYEARLNRFVPRYPMALLCLYDLDHLGGKVLFDVLKTHPQVLMGSTVVANPFYLEPDEFLASRG
jgi:hypothetical protein